MPEPSLLERTGVSKATFERLVAFRRDLHRHPELSFEEERTAGRIAAELDRLGIAYRSGVAGTGIVADLPGREVGPAVALRADMDALPIAEQTGLPFASERDGVMHACGHDGHTSMVLGAAELLAAGPPPPLPVRFIWQPAEELGEGAKAMVEAGVLDGVGMIFGGHVDRHYPAGAFAISDGAVNASTDEFEIMIAGRGGHGARPHEALDAIVVGSLLITALQTVVSREVDPAHPSVVSVGSFHAGSAPNVIADRATLEGTIRAQHPATRAHLCASVERIAKAIGAVHGAEVTVKVIPGTPPVINSPAMAELARRAARAIVGESGVVPLHTANMGGEDFAFFLDVIRGCYVRVGAQVPGREGFPAHSSRFDIDEDALAAGAAFFARVAVVAGEALLEEGRG